jgi:hypothetical protein
MERERLLETLRQLHDELSQAKSIDQDVLKQLRTLSADIQRALEDRPTSAADLEPASRGLNDLVLRFEADHPQLSVAIGRVADALAAMGI